MQWSSTLELNGLNYINKNQRIRSNAEYIVFAFSKSQHADKMVYFSRILICFGINWSTKQLTESCSSNVFLCRRYRWHFVHRHLRKNTWHIGIQHYCDQKCWRSATKDTECTLLSVVGLLRYPFRIRKHQMSTSILKKSIWSWKFTLRSLVLLFLAWRYDLRLICKKFSMRFTIEHEMSSKQDKMHNKT